METVDSKLIRIAGDMLLHQPNHLERPTQSQMREHRNRVVNWSREIADIAKLIRKNEETKSAVDNAFYNLPVGYTINVVIERNYVDAVLFDDDGEECEFVNERESLGKTITSAVEFAIDEILELAADDEAESK